MNFLVLASGRSGSTMLVNCLSSHPNVRCHHEPFNQNGWHEQIQHYKNSKDALNHLDHHGLSIPVSDKITSLIQQRLRLHKGRLIIDPFKNENSLVSQGFKITWAQANAMFESMNQWLCEKEDIKILFLYRRDVLARFVSYQLANMSGVWNSSHKEYTYAPFRVCSKSFNNFCDSEVILENKMLEMICSSNKQVSFICYEDLIENPLRATNEELNFLGCSNINQLNVVTKKVIANPINELVTNYQELNSDEVNKDANNKRREWKLKIEQRKV